MSHHSSLPTKIDSLVSVFCLVAAFFLISSLVFLKSHAQSSVPVGTVPATITTDTTLALANSPYYVNSDVNISDGATLTIEPGVRVLFNDKYTIYVQSGSAIVAKGTPSQHITFERNGLRWRKLWFYGNTTSYFRYVDFSGGGSSTSGESAIIEFDGPGGPHVLNNCTVQDSGHQGVAAVGSGLDLRIAGTLIRQHATFALRIDNGPNVAVTGSTFEKLTGNDAIYIPSRANVPTLAITGSNFLNGVALTNSMADATCVYAQNNWWGAANGPAGGGGGACSGVPSNSGSGSPVSAGVDWRNYRTSVAPHVGITTTPVASFTVAPDPSVAQPPGTEYTFDGSVSTDVEDYTSSLDFCWDWEDDGGGCDATAMTAIHSYAIGGWHTARLTVTDTDNLTDTVTQNILSGWPPTATFALTQTTWSQIEVDASASDDVEDDPEDLQVRWDWEGDGVWDTGVYSVTDILTHSYGHVGPYWPTLEVKDTDGVTVMLSKPVGVIPPAVNMTVSGGGTLVSADGTVTVTLRSSVITDGAVITHTPWITVPVGSDSLPGDFTYQGFTLAAMFGDQPVEQVSGSYTITVVYDLGYYGNVLGLWASESLLKLYRWSDADGQWVLVPFTVDSGLLVATTESFGDFALVLESKKVYLPLVLKSN